ncbi:hypothetical protein A2U01_0054377, partial [Trifolium medium]|nr:hypothetical protein [Trifolium medium]
DLSVQPSPAPSVEVVHEKRDQAKDPKDTTSRKNPRVDTVGSSLGAGLHKLQPGVPAADFVLPPAFGHEQLFDGQTRMLVPEAAAAIMDDLGPEALRNEIANSSVAVLKLLEVVTHLNGRECQYLKERDAARKR